jgi:hypothetical protein
MRLLMGLYARVSSLPIPTVTRGLARSLVFSLMCSVLLGGSMLRAQDNNSGRIEGTVTDPTGAAIPKATVTATNITTDVITTRQTTKTGGYLMSPLQPGEYILTVEAPGFEKHVQEHIIIDALQNLGLNVKMTVGSDQQTVTVSEAPPMLDTTDASIGGTIENEMYSQLPLSMGGAPRDPTAFQFLMPGVQEGTGRGVFAGSGQENLNEVYLDGVPMTSATAQGSATPISSAVSVDAVDQFQVKTNGGGVALGGIGVTNYTIKSGGNKFHGTVFDYTRNTLFDSWGYFAKVPAANGYATKPGEHQNSYGVALGGPIIHDKFFFFGTYEGFHYTKISNTPQYITIPTLAERTGDFTGVYGTAVAGLWDPTREVQGSGTRSTPFKGLLNGLPTYNVIPSSEFSSIDTYFQKALPAPTNAGTVNNYLSGLPLENEDYRIDVHLDYNISRRNQVSITAVGGTNGYGNEPNYSTQQQLPEPYAVGDYTNARTSSGVITYTFVASQATINTVKYGFSRTWGPGFAPSANGPYTSTAAGIGNTPPGNASNAIPDITFGYNATTTPLNPYSWGGSGDTGGGGTNTFTVIDNFTMVRGRHNVVFGLQYQWLEANGNTYGTYSNTLENDFNADDTECIGTCPTLPSGVTSGNPYASFLVGVVYRSRIEDQSITTIGGRYRPFAPYVSDNWRATSRLTMDLGLRWDYLQPYHEVLDRIAFLNPSVINPFIGYAGGLSYAGYGAGPNPQYSPYICQCSTPVRSHDSNFEPRIGVTYALSNTTVLRGGFGIMTTHAGGVGGRAGATVGTGTSEYSATTVWAQTGSTGAPAFFLNPGLGTNSPNAAYSSIQPNLSSIPFGTVPGVSLNPLSAAGNYIPSSTTMLAGGAMVGQPYGCTLNGDNSCSPEPLNYADPNYGGRGPQFMNWNFGFQHMIDKSAVLSVNYAGSQTHFLAGGGNRGYATNSVSPDYLVPLNTLLTQLPSSAITLGQVQAVLPGFTLPYPKFAGQSATVLKALSPFPQFLNNTDLWGQTGNSNYNSLQFSIIQRPWHRLSGLFNYTLSKEIDDTHGHRTQYPVGPQDGNFSHFYPSDRIDRGVGTFNQRHVINATWVYALPFGAGAIGANHFLVRTIAGGWGLSGIYKYRPGIPLQVTNAAGCNSATNGGQGTCLPDYAPGFSAKNARVNGNWGHGPGANASNVQYIQYLNPAAFQCIDNTVCGTSTTTGSWKLGNIAKAAPYNLIGPGYWDMDLGIRRTFQIRETPTFNLKFNVEADVINTTNSTFFSLGNGGAAWGTCTAGSTPSTCSNKAYGTVGGQNPNVPPRDWQFAGRFTF